MLPQIQAEESFRRVDEIAIGNGVMKKSEQQAVLQNWRRAMRTEVVTRKHKPKKKLTRDEQKRYIESMGIKVQCQVKN